jgi:hypothetical protein
VVPPKKKYVICRSMTTPAEFVMDQSPFRPTPFDRNLLHRPGRKDAAVGAGGLAVGGDPHLAVRDDPRAAGPALVGLLVTDWPRFVHGTPLMGFRTSSPLESSLWHDDNSAGTKTPCARGGRPGLRHIEYPRVRKRLAPSISTTLDNGSPRSPRFPAATR